MLPWLQIKVHDTMESVYKHIPMECLPDDYLPDDYKGPSAGPVSDVIGKRALQSTNTRKNKTFNY